jgi:hypothetical protein
MRKRVARFDARKEWLWLFKDIIYKLDLNLPKD